MSHPMAMAGCRFLVTGASSGIGRATAAVLDELGASLVLTGRRREELERTAAGLSRPAALECVDLAASAELPAWLKRIAAEGGPLDGIAHCAGIQTTMPLIGISSRHLQETLDINLNAGIALVKGYRQRGVCRTPGSVALVSSVVSHAGKPGQIAYAASKAGLEAACRCMALELARENIRVNTILPGLVETEMAARWRGMVSPEQAARMEAAHPLGTGTPRDVALMIAFLLGRETGRWITGASFVVDGGCLAGSL